MDTRARHARRTLVTGFEPLGPISVNPSAQLVEALRGRFDDSVEFAVLPTSYERSCERMAELIAEHQPESIISFGYWQGLARMRLELVGRNQASARIDDDGCATHAAAGRPRLRLARAPIVRLRLELARRRVPVVLSRHAGSFVCNHLYFSTLDGLAHARRRPRCLFVHVGNWEESPDRAKILAAAVLIVERMRR